MPNNAESESDDQWFVGVDVGGTSIKLGFASGNGRAISELSIPTDNHLGPADAIERIWAALQPTFLQHSDSIHGVGLGTPGPLDSRRGVVIDPVNLPGWRDFPIRHELARKLELPVVYTNDANAAAYGEFWIGGEEWLEGRTECGSLVLITLGTGVGTGLILNGNVVAGANDLAAECGHVSVEYGEDARICSCGRRGHLEAYASASAVSDRARLAAAQHPDSHLATVLDSSGDLTARDVYDCALKKDQVALDTVDQTADYLARGIADLAHTIDPDIVLLGGAMNFGGANCPIGQRFLHRIEETVRRSVFKEIALNLKIKFASLGGSAGWIGAAGLAKRVYDQQL